MAENPSPTPPAPAAAAQAGDAGLLGRELGGDLPCFVCGYNLRGLSVRSMCPECGTLVRATILSLVDPLASELRPIPHPRWLSAGLLLWTGGAAIGALLGWLPHCADLLNLIGFRTPRPSIALGMTFALVTSAIGSIALVRPHAGLPMRDSLCAALATLLYAPLGMAAWRFHTLADVSTSPRYVPGWSPSSQSTGLLVSSFLIIAAIILLQRPMARALVARSLLMRTGRVDRQTMYAMAIAAGIAGACAAIGRVAGHGTTLAETARIFGIVLITLGSLLLTIGILGSLLDGARIAQAIVSPRVSLKRIIREGRPAPKSSLGRLLDPSARPGDKP